jgi:hypothetical protein
MMTNKSYVVRAAKPTSLVRALVFGLMMAGCATTSGRGDPISPRPPAPDTQAERLAADLGSAIDGATVTLTDEVYLTTTLTVPAGVTLDLTADGAKLELRNGATLTVDGTVNTRGHGDHGSGWVDGGLRVGDGAATINGSGTLRLQSKGSLLNISDKQHLTLDGVTLVGIADNNDSLVVVYEGGALVMNSGAITGNTRTGEGWSGGGGVQVAKDAAFTMNGGSISGNTVNGEWAFGGGVLVEGAFTMNGGAISGNRVNGADAAAGGGVFVEADGKAGGKTATFIFAGGAISGNKVASLGNDSGSNGGGVFVGVNGIFTMKGGAISGNVSSSTWGAGGGVGVDGGETEKMASFIMDGGAISGNSASHMSGGVDVRYATFTLNGGRIQGSADSDGFTKNSGSAEGTAALFVWDSTATWGTGGAYTRGGVSQSGGSDIVPIDADTGGRTNDTLIAIPPR